MRAWITTHKRILLLKVAVGASLIGAHFYPEHMPSLLVNLVWLLLF